MAAAPRIARKRFIVPSWARATALVYASPTLSARHTRLARERHESHRQDLARGHRAVVGFLDQREVLERQWIAYRNDHASKGGELPYQRRGNMARARGD